MNKAAQASTIDDFRMHFFVPGQPTDARIQGQISERPCEPPQAHQEPEKVILGDQDVQKIMNLVINRRCIQQQKPWNRLRFVLAVCGVMGFMAQVVSFTLGSLLIFPLASLVAVGGFFGSYYASCRADQEAAKMRRMKEALKSLTPTSKAVRS